MRSFSWTLAMGAAALGVGLAAAPAKAKVAQVGAEGFVVRQVAQVPRGVDEVWALLVKPAAWWDSDHTWSGSAANLTIDARAGGCFCELLPGDKAGAPARGSVEHMRVVYVERPRALRMTGGLGPLQAEAVNATLTIQLKPDAQGTQVLMEYVVGGFARTGFATLAPAVDAMLGAQVGRLVGKLGGAFASAFTGPAPAEPGNAPPANAPESPPAPEDTVPEAEAQPTPEPAPAEGPVPDVVPLAETPPPTSGAVVGR